MLPRLLQSLNYLAPFGLVIDSRRSDLGPTCCNGEMLSRSERFLRMQVSCCWMKDEVRCDTHKLSKRSMNERRERETAGPLHRWVHLLGRGAGEEVLSENQSQVVVVSGRNVIDSGTTPFLSRETDGGDVLAWLDLSELMTSHHLFAAPALYNKSHDDEFAMPTNLLDDRVS